MSRAKKSRKVRAKKRQAKRAVRLEARLEEARERLAKQRELADIRKKIDETDAPESLKTIAKFIIDPIGFSDELVSRELARAFEKEREP